MYAAKRAGKGQIALYEPSMVLPEAADLRYRPLLIEAIRAGAIDCVFQPIIDLRHRAGACDGGARPVAGRRADVVDRTTSSSSPAGSGCCPALTDLMLERACAPARRLVDTAAAATISRSASTCPPGLMTDRDFPRRVAASAAAARARRRPAGAGDHRGRPARRDRGGPAGCRSAAPARGSALAGRLRHRLLLAAEPAADLAAGGQDRHRVRREHPHRSVGRAVPAGAAGARAGTSDLLVTPRASSVPEQAEILRALGCRFAQGYLYARPAPAAELDAPARRTAVSAPSPPSPTGQLRPSGVVPGPALDAMVA